MTRNSALLALAFAAILVVIDVVLFLDGGKAWAFSVAGLISAATLSWGGVRSLSQGSSRLLSGAWGVAVGLFWMTFFAHTEALNAGTQTPYGGGTFSDGLLTLVLGAMLVASIAGLVLSLSRRSL
ncbi:hypothetical protein [Hyphomonas sp.]|uniref:hypothetical protein n=1 Tax=Hyphomonas sp. TaxID=87 RepID=UPI00391A2655